MEPGHVTDDVSAPAVDDDVNNPFYEPPVRTPSTSSSAASDLRAKLHPGTYLRKLQTSRQRPDSTAKAPDTGSGSWWRSAAWSSVVHVVIVSSRHKSRLEGVSDVYVKFKFANERYRTRVRPKSSYIEWIEQFELHVLSATTPAAGDDVTVTSSSRSSLEILLRSRDHALIGSTCVDVLSLDKDDTHDVQLCLDNDAGLVRLLITVSDTRLTTDNQQQNQPTSPSVERRRPSDRSTAVQLYNGLINSFRSISDVGWLQVKVLQARGLMAADVRGTSDPYCVIQLINSRRQAHTEYRTLSPVWNRSFTFVVTDIHAVLEVVVFDENPDKKAVFLGKIAIPLLRIYAGEKRWYVLKDMTLGCRAKGSIQLEMDVVFNNFKAAIWTFNPRQPQYTQFPDKFSIAVMKRNVARLKKIAQFAQQTLNVVIDCLDWRSKLRSSVALLVFSAVVLLCEPFLVPLVLLIIFLANLFVKRVKRDLQRAAVTADNDETVAEDEDWDAEEKDGEKDDKAEKKGVVEKLQTIQEICIQVQESMDIVASMFERVENAMTWKVRWMSWLAVIMLIIGTVVLYVVPLRYVLLIWGLVKFTAKLRCPDADHHIGLLEFLARVPSNRQLMEYRELTAAAAADRKKKQ